MGASVRGTPCALGADAPKQLALCKRGIWAYVYTALAFWHSLILLCALGGQLSLSSRPLHFLETESCFFLVKHKAHSL